MSKLKKWLIGIGIAIVALAVGGYFLFRHMLGAIIPSGGQVAMGVKLNNPGNIHQVNRKMFRGQIYPSKLGYKDVGTTLCQFRGSISGIAAIMGLLRYYGENHPTWTLKQALSYYASGNENGIPPTDAVKMLPILDQPIGLLQSKATMILVVQAMVLGEVGARYRNWVYAQAWKRHGKAKIS